MRRSHAVVAALAAAVLFGLSAPAAKLLVGAIDPWLLAGLLYLASGIGLAGFRLARGLRRGRPAEAAIVRGHLPRLASAIIVGGVIGPVLLMFGLASGSAAQASLLLNLEGVLTALLAWSIAREHVDARIATGLAAIGAGAVVLAWQPGAAFSLDRSSMLVGAACLAWAIDNNLTRGVSAGDPVQIAAWKGAVAGIVNVAIAIGTGAEWPRAPVVVGAAIVGVLGYGTSLALFVRALRELGSARTGAYFSTAPFVGAAAAVIAMHEPVTITLVLAAALMAVGVWLHLTERHGHEHMHDPIGHDHLHWHDEHHDHEHAPDVEGREPHVHWHVHRPLRHSHPHYPDLHHRHPH
jgi:drug/metabolite transporter (DMT)-like permease